VARLICLCDETELVRAFVACAGSSSRDILVAFAVVYSK
jgi:hypothetical protein